MYYFTQTNRVWLSHIQTENKRQFFQRHLVFAVSSAHASRLRLCKYVIKFRVTPIALRFSCNLNVFNCDQKSLRAKAIWSVTLVVKKLTLKKLTFSTAATHLIKQTGFKVCYVKIQCLSVSVKTKHPLILDTACHANKRRLSAIHILFKGC